MAQAATTGRAGAACRLDAYRLAVEFDRLVFGLALKGDLRNQLLRASASCALNLAEGYGRFSRKDKRHFYTMALGSARECAGVLELAGGRGVTVPADAVAVIARVIRATEGLVRRMG